MLIWLQFIVVTAAIVFAGTRLSTYGDVIAEKSGLGRTWIGVVLLASVTSLPELMTGISSVAIFDLPNIAAGDVLGSCMFNILIIGGIDAISGRTSLSVRAHQGQVLTAGFGILLLGLVNISIFANEIIPSIGWVGLYSFVFLAVYLLSMRLVFLYERKRTATRAREVAEDAQYETLPLTKSLLMFGLFAVIIIAAATYLPHIGEEIAEITGLGRTFVGTMFIAFSTSLPEVVVSIAAVRMGAVDLAVGNLLGSNLFNIGILGVDDLLYTQGPLLSAVSTTHAISANAAMAMTAVAVIGLIYRKAWNRFFLSWESLGIISIYFSAALLLYVMR